MAWLNGQLSFKLIASLSHTTNKAAIIGMTRQLPSKEASTGSASTAALFLALTAR